MLNLNLTYFKAVLANFNLFLSSTLAQSETSYCLNFKSKPILKSGRGRQRHAEAGRCRLRQAEAEAGRAGKGRQRQGRQRQTEAI